MKKKIIVLSLLLLFAAISAQAQIVSTSVPVFRMISSKPSIKIRLDWTSDNQIPEKVFCNKVSLSSGSTIEIPMPANKIVDLYVEYSNMPYGSHIPIKITRFSCSENELTDFFSLGSLEGTVNLERLDLEYNKLTKLDVSIFLNLKIFGCFKNNLTSLDVSKCTKLSEFRCDDNALTSLDVSKCKELKRLDCFRNVLTSLDVSKCTKLTELTCFGIALTSLDVSKCTELEWLNCSFNGLTSLDVSKCTELKRLFCYGNVLTSLDVSKCPKLIEFRCFDNAMTSLDVSKCPDLRLLHCENNKLEIFNLKGCGKLIELSAQNQSVSAYISGGIYKNPILYTNPTAIESILINGVNVAAGGTLPLPSNVDTITFTTKKIVNYDIISYAFSGKITLIGYTPPPATISVTGVEIIPSSLSLTAGGDVGALSVKVTPANASNKNVTWSNSNESVATVSALGIVTPIAAGTTTITVKTVDGNKTTSCLVTVAPAVGNDNIGSRSFSAYPNPASDIITVTGVKQGGIIRLYNMTGTRIGSYIATSEKTTLDLSALTPGMYFLSVDGQTMKVIRK